MNQRPLLCESSLGEGLREQPLGHGGKTRQLFARLAHYCPNLRKVVIKTHAVFVVQATTPGLLLMIDDLGEADQRDITVRQYTSNRGNLFPLDRITLVSQAQPTVEEPL